MMNRPNEYFLSILLPFVRGFFTIRHVILAKRQKLEDFVGSSSFEGLVGYFTVDLAFDGSGDEFGNEVDDYACHNAKKDFLGEAEVQLLVRFNDFFVGSVFECSEQHDIAFL